ncbi:GntR family transcriptional regulator [Jonesiaceae bacterium BS-20]|uniref:GntR family transcriptional regulator n=1 Tax=Jonesiaceae bacterium BS-20 TaxID=3120821 RepID=A0AAU7DSL6_9MICO
MFTDDKPLFQQVADLICSDILRGTYAEGDQVSSTNDFAAFYRINPATAGKGINLLVDQEILYKKRGIGMFVAQGAREKLLATQQGEFMEKYVAEFVTQARALGLNLERVQELIAKEYRDGNS